MATAASVLYYTPSITVGGCNYSVHYVWKWWNGGYVTTDESTAVTVTSCNNISHGNVWATWNCVYLGQPPLGAITVTSSGIDQEMPSAEEWAQRQKAYDAEHLRKKKADTAARSLLLKHLSSKQREQFEREQVFEVVGRSKQRRYRIAANGAVHRIDDKGPVESYCIHPPNQHEFPVADIVLAKKLMLEYDEDQFLKTANATRLRA